MVQNSSPTLFPFLFLNEIGGTTPASPKIGEIEVEINPFGEPQSFQTFSSIDAALSFMFSEGFITPTVSEALKKTIIPTLYQSFTKQLKDEDKLSYNRESPTRFTVRLVFLGESNPRYHSLKVTLSTGFEASERISIDRPTLPGQEHINTKEHLPDTSKLQKQFRNQTLGSLDPSDQERFITTVSQPESTSFSEKDLKELSSRFAKHMGDWITKFNKTHKHQFNAFEAYKQHLGTDEVSQGFSAEFQLKGSSPLFPYFVRFQTFFSLEKNLTNTIQLRFSIDLDNSDRKKINMEIPRSHDPYIQAYYNGFLGMEKIVNRCMSTAYNTIQKKIQDEHIASKEAQTNDPNLIG